MFERRNQSTEMQKQEQQNSRTGNVAWTELKVNIQKKVLFYLLVFKCVKVGVTCVTLQLGGEGILPGDP